MANFILNVSVAVAGNGSGLGDGLDKSSVSRNKSLINNQKYNKMKKVDKSSSAGTTVDCSTNVDISSVCQTIAKPNVRRRFWYKTDVYSCVLCGKEKKYKERVYDEKDKGTIWHDDACHGHFM